MQAHGTSWGEIISKWRKRSLSSLVSSLRNLMWLPRDLHAYRRFDAIVAVGERVYADLQRNSACNVLPTAKVQLISNGIDTAVFRPDGAARQRLRARLAVSDSTPIVISASRLHAQKGLQHGIRAFARLLQKMPDTLYLIAGDGPERQRLEALANQRRVAERVRFLGAVEREELANWLQVADAFLFLTEHVEGLPLNVLEALACGLPAVVSHHLRLFSSPAIHFVPPQDSPAVCTTLHRLLTSPRSSAETALPVQYHLDYSARKYIELLDLLSGRTVGL